MDYSTLNILIFLTLISVINFSYADPKINFTITEEKNVHPRRLSIRCAYTFDNENEIFANLTIDRDGQTFYSLYNTSYVMIPVPGIDDILYDEKDPGYLFVKKYDGSNESGSSLFHCNLAYQIGTEFKIVYNTISIKNDTDWTSLWVLVNNGQQGYFHIGNTIDALGTYHLQNNHELLEVTLLKNNNRIVQYNNTNGNYTIDKQNTTDTVVLDSHTIGEQMNIKIEDATEYSAAEYKLEVVYIDENDAVQTIQSNEQSMKVSNGANLSLLSIGTIIFALLCLFKF